MVFYGKPTKHLGKPRFVEMAHTARPDLGSVSRLEASSFQR